MLPLIQWRNNKGPTESLRQDAFAGPLPGATLFIFFFVYFFACFFPRL
jgi:hypothetical protein